MSEKSDQEFVDACIKFRKSEAIDEKLVEAKIKEIYVAGYEAGHNDTVESSYTDAGEKFNDYLNDGEWPIQQIIALVSKRVQAEPDDLKDAERYRYLRNHPHYGGSYKHRLEWYLPRSLGYGLSLQDQLDMCIDDAITRTTTGE